MADERFGSEAERLKTSTTFPLYPHWRPVSGHGLPPLATLERTCRDVGSARSPLLIFRVLYFMLPFCAAVLLLSAREGWLASKIAADKARTAATKNQQLS